MQLEIRNAEGERLEHTFHPGAGANAPVVVLGHGVTANKDRPFLVALAEGLARAGLAALRFSFAGNGGSEGSFGAATVTKETADLGSVLDALEGAGARRLAYVGHSQGGAVGLLRAGADARLSQLVSLAGMVDVAAFARRKFGDLTPGRDVMWDKAECPLSREYVDDMERLGDLARRAAEVSVPWLLVHGRADEVVPIEDSRRAAERAGGETELVELTGCDHVFSGESTERMVAAVVPWLSARLS